MTMHRNHEQKHSDPAVMWRNALASFVSASVEALTTWLDREYARPVDDEHDHSPALVADSERLEDAAALLGVALPATAEQIRAAFRGRVKTEMRTGTFHDHGGDATDDRARQLIAAKNLLIEHVAEVANG